MHHIYDRNGSHLLDSYRQPSRAAPSFGVVAG